MTFGAMSDTHGNHAGMFQAAENMRAGHGVECIFHLGDDYQDAELLAQGGFNMRMVPGLWCPEYQNARIPNVLVEDIGGVSVAAAHAEKDLRGRERGCTVILIGHTHVPCVRVAARSLHINPGHLRPRTDRGAAPSFAVISLEPDRILARVFGLDGSLHTEGELGLEPELRSQMTWGEGLELN